MKRTLVGIAALLVALAIPAYGLDVMAEFPEAGVYTIHSEPSFNVVVGDKVEVVTCKAELVLRTGTPYVTAEGKRHVDLEIIDWHATGTSKLFGGELNFQMLQGVPTPEKSYVESYHLYNAEDVRDFPAHAQFAVPYELDTPFGKVSGLFGLTEGTIRAFPPRGDIFTMQKGDTAELMAELMPEPVSSLSAAGEVTPVNVTVRPAACLCPEIE